MAESYQQASHQLHQILASTAYTPQRQVTPWWVAVIRFIERRLQIHLGHSSWLTIAIVTAAIIFVIFSFALLQLIRKMGGHGSGVFRQHNIEISFETAIVSELAQAHAALESSQYDEMMHFLVAVIIRLASKQGWLQVAPYRTIRWYRRELLKSATPTQATKQLLEDVTTAAEQIWFAEIRMNQAEAKFLWQRVQDWTKEVGK